jgi:hypothetical protein
MDDLRMTKEGSMTKVNNPAWSPVKAWSDHVAALAVDGLREAALIDSHEFEKFVAIVSEELFIRLGLHDYPPAPPDVA